MRGGDFLNHVVITLVCYLLGSLVSPVEALATEPDEKELRMQYYMQYERLSTPWYYLAAIDQYERNIQAVRQDIPKRDSVIAIQFSDEYWSGVANPLARDTSPHAIAFFGGMGLDGNADGYADILDDDDVLFTMANYLNQYGQGEDEFKLALWDYYRNEQTVNQIVTIAKLFKRFGTVDLDKHVFPITPSYAYSYSGTWGANRGWGGRRIHEGTDIYAAHSTPLVSTSYGVIEIMGWNEFGGWRMGIRDNHNSYHYYAHLASFEKGLQEGAIVEPGQVIGYLGSTGYGKEGTAGKFPPHLHYGIYKFNGRTEWAFDPYPSLVQWEKATKNR
ncbi:MAG: M23 family metallopeptidase [Solibacillus sp.]